MPTASWPRCKARGYTVVAASSAKKNELRKLLEIAGVASLLDGATSSDDAEESKPDPDIIEAALKQAGARPRGSGDDRRHAV